MISEITNFTLVTSEIALPSNSKTDELILVSKENNKRSLPDQSKGKF